MKKQFLYVLAIIILSNVAGFAQTSFPQESAGAVSFNRQPFRDFAAQYGGQILSKEIDMNAPLEIILTGTLDGSGKITNPFVKSQKGNNPKTLEVYKAGIQLISDSQVLKLLYDVGARNITTTTVQGANDLRIKLDAALASESEARRVSHGLTLIVAMLKSRRPGADEVRLAEKIKADVLGKNLILNFAIPHDEKIQLLEKNLKLAQEWK